MAFIAIQEYDATTAANNSDIAGANIAEGCAPSGINNALRDLCKQLRRAVANQGADIASAATTDIGAATGQYVKVTGTTTITALGTVNAGTARFVEFTGSLTLTHNGTSLILPGAANIVTQIGDVGVFVSQGSGNWKMLDYLPGNQTPRLSFSVHRNGTVQALSATTYTKVQFTTEDFDIGGYFDNATNYRWTPPAGKYFVTGVVGFVNSLVDGNNYRATMYKNGVAARESVALAPGTGGGAGMSAVIAATFDMNGTDYLELFAYRQDAGDIFGTSLRTHFEGGRIV